MNSAVTKMTEVEFANEAEAAAAAAEGATVIAYAANAAGAAIAWANKARNYATIINSHVDRAYAAAYRAEKHVKSMRAADTLAVLGDGCGLR